MDKRSFSDKFWNDKYGQTVIWQKPNAWIIVAAVAILFALFLPLGTVERIISYVAYFTLAVWAGLELFRGANYFRRLLGFAVLLLAIVTILW